MNIKSEIERIAEEVHNCSLECNGVCHDPDEGIHPRCLFFEDGKGDEDKGVVIVGMNPGRANKHEMEELKNATYEEAKEFWERHNKYGDGKNNTSTYFSDLRKIAEELGLNGPIIWTDLTKCQNKKVAWNPLNQTHRKCITTHLIRELKDINWPIIAAGKDAYNAISYLYLKHTVVGVPHPSRRSSHLFKKLFTGGKLKEEYKLREGEAVWFQTTKS